MRIGIQTLCKTRGIEGFPRILNLRWIMTAAVAVLLHAQPCYADGPACNLCYSQPIPPINPACANSYGDYYSKLLTNHGISDGNKVRQIAGARLQRDWLMCHSMKAEGAITVVPPMPTLPSMQMDPDRQKKIIQSEIDNDKINISTVETTLKSMGDLWFSDEEYKVPSAQDYCTVHANDGECQPVMFLPPQASWDPTPVSTPIVSITQKCNAEYNFGQTSDHSDYDYQKSQVWPGYKVCKVVANFMSGPTQNASASWKSTKSTIHFHCEAKSGDLLNQYGSSLGVVWQIYVNSATAPNNSKFCDLNGRTWTSNGDPTGTITFNDDSD